MNPSALGETTIADLGNASRFFENVAIKLLDNKAIPGLLFHGIVYLDVKEEVRIFKVLFSGQSLVLKQVSGKNPSNTETVS